VIDLWVFKIPQTYSNFTKNRLATFEFFSPNNSLRIHDYSKTTSVKNITFVPVQKILKYAEMSKIIEDKIAQYVYELIPRLFGEEVEKEKIALQPTRKEFEGDFTLVVFPFTKLSRRSPEETAGLIGDELVKGLQEVSAFNVIKGFLNISLSPQFWMEFLISNHGEKEYGLKPVMSDDPVVIEYSSPNTNKPLHLGHVRNNLLGFSVSRILEAAGHKTYKVNLVNDRGIHICKSMLAWLKWGNDETPESTGKKGDKLVGDYYVRFETELRKEAKFLRETQGLDEETSRNNAPLMEEAREMLRKWEARDPETMKVWETMNQWVYDGFDATYKRMGVDFEKIYYESDTYLLGKTIVNEGLEKGVFYRREDGSVWVDLRDQGLDEKLLLRSDGTSVYMTQDIGTAQLRYDDFKARKMIYVVGNEQNYHFDVLKKILIKLGKPYGEALYHLSYGMVELPQGKMKSREGTVVDADELMDEMYNTAKTTTETLGKVDDFTEDEKKELFYTIGMGALKYFILKVDPKKNMLFNPEESIDFNGNTGPFIQYTYARICSILRKAKETGLDTHTVDISTINLNNKERSLIKSLYSYPQEVLDAANGLTPATIANFVYETAKEFNQFYHEFSVLNEPDKNVSAFRLKLCILTAHVIKSAMSLLGIDVPERM
jgi:arginyl-tRNA synthetase